jgi:DNA polymerase I-like protein with 3'-5' exonuclease and polymerase domains
MLDFSSALEAIRRPNVSKKTWMNSCELILGTEENLNQCIEECLSVPFYGLDTETTGLDTRVFNGSTRDSLVGICLAPTKDKGYYFPVGHLHDGSRHNIPWRIMGPALDRLFDLSNQSAPVLHNASFDQEILEFNGFYKGLGEARWDNHKAWHDTLVLKYLLNPREKFGRGLKKMSLDLLGREMLELDDITNKEEGKDYSKIDPSWDPCVWYAAADAMNTLGVFEILYEEYTNKKEHTMFIYNLERMTLTATRWMHRNRVYVNRETALNYAKQGQALWFDSLLEVYKGASELLERDITPNFVKILTGEIKGINKFDPNEVEEANYKLRVDEARKEAKSACPDTQGVITKAVPYLDKPAGTENIDFPLVYDILSPQQLGLLFRELKVPGLIATGASGQVATSKDVLDSVVENASKEFPFMGKIKTFRELGKAMGQYLIPFVEDVGPDGTLKPTFKQFSADTGRFSCKTNSKPWKVKDGGCRVPFQGIPATYDPKKPEAISKMRKCIGVRNDDWWLAAIDYAGVELRLVTNLSGETLWEDAFFRCSECNTEYDKTIKEDGFAVAPPPFCTSCGSDKIGDLHTITAVAFYGEGAKKEEDWKKKRGHGKSCNFALSYGGTGKAVQRSIPKCTAEEGEEKYKLFTKTYKRLTAWWSEQHEFARKNGYVKTGMGRVQPLPDINNKKEFGLRSKDERKAVNGPVQGTSADVTKLAMGLIYKEVKKRGWMDKFMMILTVHDEVVFEIHKSILKEAVEVVSHLMTRNEVIKHLGWLVPLTVDVEFGKDWTVPYDLKDILEGEGDEELVKIFGGKKTEKEVVKPTPEPAKKIATLNLDNLSDNVAWEVASWIKDQDGEWDVTYGGRSIKALLL